MLVEIKNNIAFIRNGKKIISYITFPVVKDNVVNINRTYTSVLNRGQGLAKITMDGLYVYLKENNLQAIPSCSYIEAYFKRYQDKQDVLYKEL